MGTTSVTRSRAKISRRATRNQPLSFARPSGPVYSHAGAARPAATEFSFLLYLPGKFAATGLDLAGNRDILTVADAPV